MNKPIALLVDLLLFTACIAACDVSTSRMDAQDTKTSPADDSQKKDSAEKRLNVKEPVDVPPIAMVLTTKGKITVVRAPDKPRQLLARENLYVGDSLETDKDGTATLLFFIGKADYREGLKRNSQVVVGEKGCVPEDAVEKVKISHRLSGVQITNIRSLARSGSIGGVIFRASDAIANPQSVTPIYGATILTDRPTFTWPIRANAEEYQVRLLNGYEGNNGSNVLIWETSTKHCLLAFPDNEKALADGQTYRWRVFARASGTEDHILHVDSKFRIATKLEETEIAQLKPLVDSDAPDDWLLAATIYESNGADEEALRCYERLAEHSPKEVNFQRALACYYERAGRIEESKKARLNAEKLGAVLPSK